MPGRRANTAPYEANPADLATALPTSTLADTKHTGGDDSPTAVFLTAQTTSYPCASSTDRFETPASPEAADDGYDELDPSVQAAINQEYINSLYERRGTVTARAAWGTCWCWTILCCYWYICLGSDKIIYWLRH